MAFSVNYPFTIVIVIYDALAKEKIIPKNIKPILFSGLRLVFRVGMVAKTSTMWVRVREVDLLPGL
jgi:hypothetical protein